MYNHPFINTAQKAFITGRQPDTPWTIVDPEAEE